MRLDSIVGRANGSKKTATNEAHSRFMMYKFKRFSVGDLFIVTQTFGKYKFFKSTTYLASVDKRNKSVLWLNRGGNTVTINVGAFVMGEFRIEKI
jgi:hypothetical protein